MSTYNRLLKEVKQGNVSYFYKSWGWQQRRLDILERDNYECQHCKEEGRVTTGERLIVHHKKELKDFPNLMFEEDNLITVCFSCHEKIHERGMGRESPGESMGIPERW